MPESAGALHDRKTGAARSRGRRVRRMSLRMSTPLLQVDRVTKTYGGGLLGVTRTLALDDFSLTISTEKPSVTAVVGESGSGKTTLARVLLGLTTPTSGTVRYR